MMEQAVPERRDREDQEGEVSWGALGRAPRSF